MSSKITIYDTSGVKYFVTRSPHALSWRFIVVTSNGDIVGDMLVKDEEADIKTLHLSDIHIKMCYAKRGIGRQLIAILKDYAKEHGYKAIFGICKSYDHPLSEKSKLANWYLSQGFTLNPEIDPQEPGYMGTLFFHLE